MIFIWVVFTSITGYIYSKANKTPLESTTPRLTYSWFAVANSFTYSLSVVGYFLIILEILGFLRAIAVLFSWDSSSGSVGYLALMFMFYGLYFGVLSRDCAELCTDSIANKMGFTGKGLPAKSIPLHKCCICGDFLSTSSNSFFLFGIISKIANSLRDKNESSDSTSSSTSGRSPDHSNVNSSSNISNSNYIVTLNCSHKYHEWCIRGWTMIGKKDTCPYCSEKVQLKTIFKNPWEKQGILWAHLLDSIRYLIVWNPIIIITLNLVIYFVDPGA